MKTYCDVIEGNTPIAARRLDSSLRDKLRFTWTLCRRKPRSWFLIQIQECLIVSQFHDLQNTSPIISVIDIARLKSVSQRQTGEGVWCQFRTSSQGRNRPLFHLSEFLR